jgi:hypothetical protein
MCGHTPSLSRSIALAALLGTLAACGGNKPVAGRVPTPTRTTSALALHTAIVVPTTTTLSCHGRAFCREDVIGSGHDEAVEEATEDCTRRGGEPSASHCERDAIVASCSLSGEAGSITVFAYAQTSGEQQSESVSKMSELCEQFDGSFELAVRRGNALAAP